MCKCTKSWNKQPIFVLKRNTIEKKTSENFVCNFRTIFLVDWKLLFFLTFIATMKNRSFT